MEAICWKHLAPSKVSIYIQAVADALMPSWPFRGRGLVEVGKFGPSS